MPSMNREGLLEEIRITCGGDATDDELNECLDYIQSLSIVELAELIASAMVLNRDAKLREDIPPVVAYLANSDGGWDNRVFSWETRYEVGVWLLSNPNPYVRGEGGLMILEASRAAASDEEHAQRLANFLGDREALLALEDGGLEGDILGAQNLSDAVKLRLMPHIMRSREVERRATREAELLLTDGWNKSDLAARKADE